MRIILLIIISVTILFSKESFEFEFENFENNRLSSIKIYKNNIYISGYAYLNNRKDWDNYIIKYDMQGNQIFNKIFYHDYQDAVINMEIKDDLIYILADWQPTSSSYDDSILNIFDLDGNLITNTAFGSSSDDMIADQLILNNEIYLCGSDQNGNYFINLNKSNLKKNWVRYYTGIPSYRSEGLIYKNDYFYTCGYNVYRQSEFIVQKIDPNGNPVLSKTIDVGTKVILIDGYIIDDYYYVVGRNFSSSSTKSLFFLQFDLELNLIKSKEIFVLNATFNNDVKLLNGRFYYTYSLNNKSYLSSIDKNLSNSEDSEITNVTKLIDIQDRYFIYFIDGEKSKLIFDRDNCYLNKYTELIQIKDVNSNIKTLNNIDVNQGQNFKQLTYNIKNGMLEMLKSQCPNYKPSPCGDGSFFETNVNSLDDFSLLSVEERSDKSFILTDKEKYFGYGSITHNNPVYVTAGFETEFAFKVSDGYNDFNDGSVPGADGFTLLFSEEPVYNFKDEQLGGGLGYHRRKNGIALEIDLYKNNEFNDPNGNHIALQRKGDRDLYAIHNDENTLGINSEIIGIELDTNITYYCKMIYSNRRLQIWIDDSNSYQEPAIEIENFEFSDKINLIDNTKLFVSLSAVTGTSYQRQEVVYWDWCSSFDPMSNIEVKTSNSEIKIYPNPSSDMIYIKGVSPNEEIEIVDVTGRNVLIKKYNDGLNISDLQRGIYLIKINNVNYKVIKE